MRLDTHFTESRGDRNGNRFVAVPRSVFPGGVTGDRFSRRENLMEKSEVSDTDAPAIRQAIHGSSLRAFLSAARRGEAKREGEPGRA